MSKKKSAPQIEASIDVDALRAHYPGRFEEHEIPCESLRAPLNATCRALEGIKAVTKILYANEIERHSSGDQAVTLDSSTAYGLFEALMFLAHQGGVTADDLGDVLFKQAKGGA